MENNLKIQMDGHVLIKDDLGNTLLDKTNSIHPQNMARVITRALSNESNYYIHRIAFGSGGTQTDAAFTVTFNEANDGQSPDVRTWDSRLYNEIYSEIIDDNISPIDLLGTDPGSAGPNVGTRAGGGHAGGDPSSTIAAGPGVRSNELGITSKVEVSVVMNPNEPQGYITDGTTSATELFTFDEIGLYTKGANAIDSNGSFDVEVGNRTSEDDSQIVPKNWYRFIISVDGSDDRVVDFQAGGVSGTEFVTGTTLNPTAITYGDICEAINTGNPAWNPAWSGTSPLPGGAIVSITDNTGGTYSSIVGAQTFGFLHFTSSSTGISSSVVVKQSGVTCTTSPCDGTSDPGEFAELFLAGAGGLGVNRSTGGATFIDALTGTPGTDAGVQNNAANPENERERLLTHLVFSPVVKAENRTLTVTYSIIVSLARS